MIERQNHLRNQVKRLKWEEDISYKTIAEDLLQMDYHAFINFMHGYKNLGKEREIILKEFIETIL